jgi:carboxyl-terminal processing protease
VTLEPLKAGQSARPDVEQFEGVGMTLELRNGRVFVTQVSEGAPAERAGVQPGDGVMAVNAEPTAGKNLNDVVGRIRGPAGTPVTLTFERGGRTFDLTIRRKLLTL